MNAKTSMYINSTREGLHYPRFKSLAYAKKFGSPQWPIAQYEFRIRITQRIERAKIVEEPLIERGG